MRITALFIKGLPLGSMDLSHTTATTCSSGFGPGWRVFVKET